MARITTIDDTVREKMLAEYLSDSRVSLAGLAKKYNITYSSLTKLAKAEGWNDKRSTIRTKEIDAAMEYITRTQSVRLRKAIDASDKAIDVASKTLTKLQSEMDAGGTVDTKTLRDISGVLRDLKDYQILRYDLDRREQEARIAKMEHDAQQDGDQAKEITVKIEEASDKWQG